jgi:Tfp pilus assembly protein PilF
MKADRIRRVFWALLGLKGALSVSLLFGYLGSPLGAGLSLDEESYFAWAQRILSGDLAGQLPYFQDPLYPHVLAGVLGVSGGSVTAARGFNLALGVLTLVLLERVVRRLFSPAQALWAMGLWLLIGSVALDELTLAKEPLLIALLLGAGALALEVDARRPGLALLTGLLGGGLVLVRGNFLALLPFAALLAFVQWPRKIAGLAVVGMLFLPALVSLRNGVQEGRWMPTTASSGMVFFIGHHPGADGTWVRAPFASGTPLEEMPDYVREASRQEGKPVSAAKASRRFADEGLRFILEHPGDELALLLKKVRLTFSWEEVPGNYSLGCIRDRFVGGLWLTPLPGAVLWPLALAAVIAHRKRRAVQAIAAAWLIYAATLWLTFIVERYRLPLWVASAVLAPAGWVALRQWLSGPLRFRVLAAGVPVLAALAWPVRESSPERELAHCLSLAGATLLQAHRLDEARPLLLEAAALDPTDGEVAFNLGVAHQLQNEWPQAVERFRTATRINPRNVPAWWGLATASLTTGEAEQARSAFEAFFAQAAGTPLEQACLEVSATPSLHGLLPRCDSSRVPKSPERL